MNYHVGRAGQQLGVFTLDDIRAKLATGEFRSDDLGWSEGMNDWKPLGELVPGVQPAFATPPPIRRDSSTLLPPTPPLGGTRHLGAKPSNNLVGAILVTLFCCLPFGIPAIIYASQVDSKYNVGDHAGAEVAAAKSKKWMWIAFTIGLVASLAYFGIMALGVASGAAQQGGF